MHIDQQRLSQAHALVVGCGALGNEVLKGLTLMGVGRLTVVDFDNVEATNLSRSVLFRRTDVGRRKVDVVAERLWELNPDLLLDTICGDVAHDVGLGRFAEADVIIGCVDSRWARYMINRHCMRMQRPWVDGGISQWEGTVRVLMPGRNCYACSLDAEAMNQLRRRLPCSGTIRRMEEQGHAPTTAVAASIIGAMQVQEAVKLIAGLDNAVMTGRMFCYEGEGNTSRMVTFSAYDPDCPEHEAWQPVEPLRLVSTQPALTGQTTIAALLTMGFSTLTLRDDCFVDYIYDKESGKRYEMMCAGRKVAERMEKNDELRGRLLGDFYQNEYRTIDAAFPYKNLTLHDLGIPSHDVLQLDERYILIQ